MSLFLPRDRQFRVSFSFLQCFHSCCWCYYLVDVCVILFYFVRYSCTKKILTHTCLPVFYEHICIAYNIIHQHFWPTTIYELFSEWGKMVNPPYTRAPQIRNRHAFTSTYINSISCGFVGHRLPIPHNHSLTRSNLMYMYIRIIAQYTFVRSFVHLLHNLYGRKRSKNSVLHIIISEHTHAYSAQTHTCPFIFSTCSSHNS